MIGLGSFVDIDAGKDFRRILVELDRAAVVGGGLLPPVERRAGEVRAEAADRDDVGAASITLRGKAGEAGDRFADAVVRQFADVFGRNRFDHRLGRLLLRGRAAQRCAEAGDDDIFVGIGCSGCVRRRSGRGLRLRGSRADQQQRRPKRAHAGAQRQAVAKLRRLTAHRCDHAISPLRLHGVCCALSVSSA